MQVEDYIASQLKAIRQNMYIVRLESTKTYNDNNTKQTLYDYRITFTRQTNNMTRRATNKSTNAKVEFNIRVLIDSDGEIIRSKILNEKGKEIPVITDRVVDEYFSTKTIPISETYRQIPKIRRGN